MKKALTKALCLLVTLTILMSYAVLPVFADTTAASSQVVTEPAASDVTVAGQSLTGEISSGASETAQPQQPVIPNEPIAQAPAGGENEVLFTLPLAEGTTIGDEPVTGGGKTAALQVLVNYPNGKSALKQGDIVTLLFKLINFADNDRLHGTTEANGKTVEKGIGAYMLKLTYDSNLEVYGTPVSKFTTATTPYALFEKNVNAATNTVNMVAVFSALKGTRVEALNEAALLNIDGLLATVQLRFKNNGLEDDLDLQLTGEFDYVGDDGAITPVPVDTTGTVKVDASSPVIKVTDQKSDIPANRGKAVPLSSVLAPGESVDPFAQITITDTSEITKFSVQKGTSAFKVEDSDGAPSKVAFELPEPGTYTITATDASGNISVGKVLVKPRVTDIKLALTGNTYIGETYTVTPTLVPAANTTGLPAYDKALIWTATWTGKIDDPAFFSVTGSNPFEVRQKIDNNTFCVNWRQDSPAPVKFTAIATKNYTLTVKTEKNKFDDTARATASLDIKSPVKVLSVTMAPDSKKTNLSSVLTPGDSVTVRGTIATPVQINTALKVTEADFESKGIKIIYGTRNGAILTNDTISFADTRTVTSAGKTTYYYDYNFKLTAVNNAKGLCDAGLSCGDAAAVTTFNVTNYSTALTKMTITQKASGLDSTVNLSSSFTLSLSDAANKTQVPVNPNDCILYTSNSSLLTVAATSSTQAQATVYALGARYLTAPTNVTVTAELKDDPQKRKATATYTIYPTERHMGVFLNILNATNMSVGPGGNDYTFSFNATSLSAGAQLLTLLISPVIPPPSNIITSANKNLVRFSTSNSGVATVSDTGTVSVKGYGECFITVTALDGSNTFDRVKVVSYKPITALLAANTPDNSIVPGGNLQFKLTGTLPADSTNNKLAGLTWTMKDCKDKAGKAIDNPTEYFMLDAKTGKLTSKTNPKDETAVDAIDGATVTITATVPNKVYDSGKSAFVDTTISKDFTVTVAKPNPTMLSYFTALTPGAPTVAVGSTTAIKVSNAKFTEPVQWCFVNANGVSASSVSTAFELKPSASDLGKGTLYASYMGKTLSLPVTVYDEQTQQSTKLTLEFAPGAPDYKLFDRYSATTLLLRSSSGYPIVDPTKCIFTSSMPSLVRIINGGTSIDPTQAANLNGNVTVTLTAAIKDDPYNRKATKTITVTPKILPKTIKWVDLYNSEQATAAFRDNASAVNLNAVNDKLLNTVVCETLRNGTTIYLAPEGARSQCSPLGDETYLSSGADYEAALAGLSFVSANTAVAAVNAKGIVTLTGKSSPAPFNITVAQAAGTYAALEAAPSTAMSFTVTQPCSAVKLNTNLYTMKAENTAPVSFSLTATTTPVGGKVTWESSDTKVATVDANTGKVTVKANRTAGDTTTITATSADGPAATCRIVVGEAGKTIAKVSSLTAAQKALTIGIGTYLPFRSNASGIGDIVVTSSNPSVIKIGATAENPTYNDPKNAAYKGYHAEITPVGTGTASVTVAVSGSVYTETFNVYAFDPSGSKLVLGSSLTTQMLNSSNDFNAASKQVIASALVDKSNKELTKFNKSNNAQYLTFTSSNTNILVVGPDGTFYTRNLNTITSPVNVTITAAIKGEPTKREGKITFKVTPGAAAATVAIQPRDNYAPYFKTVSSGDAPDFKGGGKAIYTDIGDPAAQRVYSLGAQLKRTDNATFMLADSSMVSWASSNNSAASVDANGTVTVRGKGTALITATAKDGSFVKDTVVIRVNNKPIVLNNVPRNYEGNPETVTLLAGGSYTIPYKLNTGTAGDYCISSYDVGGADPTAITVDQKTGKLTAKASATDKSCTVTLRFKTSKLYVYDSTNNVERFRDGIPYTDNSYGTTTDVGTEITVVVPVKVVAASSVTTKAITLYEAASDMPTAKKITKIDMIYGDQYQLYIQQTLQNGQVIPGKDAIISIERQNNTRRLSLPGSGVRASLDYVTGCFMLQSEEPGNYVMNVTLGGKTVAYPVTVYHPWYKNADGTDKQAITGSVKLTGSVISNDAKTVYSKLCRDDFAFIRILPSTGKNVLGGDFGYASNQCTYASSSPLVQVDANGLLTIAQYIPSETKVTITATLINDPAKHVVTIPITITGQHLARSVEIKNGTEVVTGKTINGIANNSSLRLTTQCLQVNGTPSDNGTVGWSSSNGSVVSVDATGKVTYKGAGTATVTAKAADGGGAQATVTFTVKKNAIT